MDIAHYADRAWGVIYTRAYHEKMVEKYLKNSGIPVYLPCLYKNRSKYHRSKSPMFKSYLFAAWNKNDRIALHSCSSIASFMETPLDGDTKIIEQLERLSQLEELSKSMEIRLRKKDFPFKKLLLNNHQISKAE